jgi:hypothetical protein
MQWPVSGIMGPSIITIVKHMIDKAASGGEEIGNKLFRGGREREMDR